MVKTRRFRNKKKVRRSRRRTRRGGAGFGCGGARIVGTKPIRPILLYEDKERCVTKNDLRGRYIQYLNADPGWKVYFKNNAQGEKIVQFSDNDNNNEPLPEINQPISVKGSDAGSVMKQNNLVDFSDVMRVESPQTGEGKGLDDVVELLYKHFGENREKTFSGKQFILYPKNWNPDSDPIDVNDINNAKRRALIAHTKKLNTIKGDFEEILKKLQKPN